MNIKGLMQARDLHMVIQPTAKLFKVFNAQGTMLFSGVFKLHPFSQNKPPVPSMGKLVLSTQANHKAIHVSHLGSYAEPSYVDIAFCSASNPVSTENAQKFTTQWDAVIYEMGDQDFKELMKCAQHLDSAVTGTALDSIMSGRSFPVVYVSIA
jgi:hypothetical protein